MTANTPLIDAVTRLGEVLNRCGGSYALIGGLAVGIRGHRRFTQDVDFLVHVPALQLPALLDSLVSLGCQLDVPAAIRQWTTDGILVFSGPNSVPVDLMKVVLPALQHVVDRARLETIADRPVRVADVEGLLLLKCLAFRPLDQEDMRGLLTASRQRLDLDWVRTEATAAGMDQVRLSAFDEMVREYYAVTCIPDGGAAGQQSRERGAAD